MSEENNLIVKTTSIVMEIVSAYLRPGDLAVDCTVGNGHDTLKLAGMVGCAEGRGRVIGFDIQQPALDAARELLRENGFPAPESSGITLLNESHEELYKYISPGEASAIVFNLGFLPGHDKTVVTSVRSTIPAVNRAIELIKEDGIIAVTVYSGHSEGREEREKLTELLASLPTKRYHVAKLDMINQKKTAPCIFFITRKKKKIH